MNKIDVISELPRQFLDTIEQFNISDKKARNFGTDNVLYLSEIHLIQYIGDSERLYVSEIARGLSITKGAVSQMVKKLEKKGYVEKILDSENKSRTLVRLTEKGKIAYLGHKEYHEYIDKLVISAIEGCSTQEVLVIKQFLKKMEENLK
ncbi:DNA-binding MarR family transcriptional regulator [Clostridium tetanomorphum]|uniref:MarR family transcriptional regulator n=1 Tax=Clostridium tetanomorphum TaxID=1553 RepID=A0A923EC79_CLOTT|nr:MarR family transcriptional regulator [Clostridium tetanomorphum]MBC2399154.1 MarR family transcriptional regulator [Clostridium tetanomorphum]MBP1865445.1 DNA-binding MarR family transcriptional regulator [Clostridium tetanomorphum]NRS84788.1 DNA-binding MarR family transcriptional regulator [Clostridium tetanomorphum]NRZ98006.1 DNA-binding MarR family transcriptional regulator [Clostridium tetanomorphum]